MQLHGGGWLLRRLTAGWQRLDFLAEPFLHRAHQRRQGIVGDRGLGDELQHLPTMRAQRQQLAQALGRHPRALTASQAHPDLAGESLCDLGQNLGGPRVQAVGIGQRHPGARPVRRHVAPQGFEHCATGGRLAQLRAAPLDQQVAQAFEHRPVRFTEAGQHEQAVERLAVMIQRRGGCDERQPRSLHRLLAAQPPEALTQRQGLVEREPGIEAGDHAFGALEQLDALPGQLIEVLGGDAQPHQLAIERQFLRRPLQQRDDRLGAFGLLQRLTEVALAEGAGQQLQQTQMLVGTRGDADGEVDLLAVAPVDALRKMQQPHARGEHLIAGFRGAMGDRDALAEKGRALGFACAQAVQVAGRHQPVGDQHLAEQGQRGRFVRRDLMHVDVLRIQLKHGELLRGSRLLWPTMRRHCPNPGLALQT